jgi:hypothetical protein
MARTHFWHYLQNEEGQPVNEADVSVYLATTTTPAWVYLSESSGTAVDTDANPISTRDDGYFEFWIADADDTYGYTGQKFKITWTKPGIIDDGYVDFVEINLATAEVDETDIDETKNKTVSNALAKSWSEKAGVVTKRVTIPEWTNDAGNYYIIIDHYLNNEFPMVIVYEIKDINDNYVNLSVDAVIDCSLGPSSIKVWRVDATETQITVIG